MKKTLIVLHRRLSIVIAIPVLLWASSGMMHPVMTNIKPSVATQVYVPVGVDPGRIRVSLDSALRRRHIDSIAAVRLVHIDTNWFYQVRSARGGAPLYLSCTNGNVLPQGDWLYAQWLARYFLEGGMAGSHGVSGGAGGVSVGASGGAGGMPAMGQMDMAGGAPDCCGAATECVLHPAKGAKVSNASLLMQFDEEYKSINRLLPVYRVSFDRPDGIRIYVETTQDRFSFAMDKRRAAFDTFFRICHTWGWLDGLGKGRLVVEVLVALLVFVTAVLGIWIFFATRRKTSGVRRWHRVTAITAALFTLFWGFSGGYHAFVKLTGHEEPAVAEAHIATAGLSLDWGRLVLAAGKPVVNVGVVRIGDSLYWQVPVSGGAVSYVSMKSYEVLTEGDRRYAEELAGRYVFGLDGVVAGKAGPEVTGTKFVTAFDDEYNFSDKRLPVWRVNYGSSPGHQRVYVETCSGALAARMDDAAYAEGYSFSVFHKHHFMDWGGKKVRDASTMIWAFAQVVLVVVGLLLFMRAFFRRRPRASYSK